MVEIVDSISPCHVDWRTGPALSTLTAQQRNRIIREFKCPALPSAVREEFHLRMSAAIEQATACPSHHCNQSNDVRTVGKGAKETGERIGGVVSSYWTEILLVSSKSLFVEDEERTRTDIVNAFIGRFSQPMSRNPIRHYIKDTGFRKWLQITFINDLIIHFSAMRMAGCKARREERELIATIARRLNNQRPNRHGVEEYLPLAPLKWTQRLLSSEFLSRVVFDSNRLTTYEAISCFWLGSKMQGESAMVLPAMNSTTYSGLKQPHAFFEVVSREIENHLLSLVLEILRSFGTDSCHADSMCKRGCSWSIAQFARNLGEEWMKALPGASSTRACPQDCFLLMVAKVFSKDSHNSRLYSYFGLAEAQKESIAQRFADVCSNQVALQATIRAKIQQRILKGRRFLEQERTRTVLETLSVNSDRRHE